MGETLTDEQARERLARFEAVLAGLVDEQERIAAELERLRAAGRTRTATYQQLAGRKLALRTAASLFEAQGLL